MEYNTFRQQLKDFNVFSLPDIRKIDPKFYPARLNEWQKKGYIKKLRRGYYMFADAPLDEETLFLIANRLYAPSYVSLESALSYYGLIPEGVYSITSVAGRKTAQFQTPIARFSYRAIQPRLLFGYRLLKKGGQGYKIAEMEKAVLDYLYLNPRIIQEADFSEWRFNSVEFIKKSDKVKLRAYAEVFRNKSLLERLEIFMTFIKNHR